MNTQDTAQDMELMTRIQARDQQAFGTLYDRFAPVVYSLCYKLLGSHADAEEVALDVFDQLWRTAERYTPERGRVDAWVFLIARSRSLDRLRKRQRMARDVETAEVIAQWEDGEQIRGPEFDVLLSERKQEVVAALGQLPEAQRLALELAYYKGLSQSEIATETGESLGTIKTRIRSGMGKLRESLAPWWNG